MEKRIFFTDEQLIIKSAYKRLSEKAYDCAIECAGYAIDHQIFPFEAHFIMGCALYELGNTNDAISEFYSALKYKPCSEKCIINIAIAKIKSGDINSLFCKPFIDLAKYPDTCMLMAIAYFYQKQYGKAQSLFASFHKAHPNSASVYINAGVCMLEKENATLPDFKRAICCFTRATKLSPLNKFAYYNRTKAYIRANLPLNALSDSKVLLQIDHNDFGFHYISGVALELNGLYSSAIAEFSIAAQSDSAYIKNASISKMKVLKKHCS